MDEYNSSISHFLGAELIEDKIYEALLDFNKNMTHIGGCSDGNCVIVKPKGMHTNGGCRCTRDYVKMQQFTFATRRLIERIR